MLFLIQFVLLIALSIVCQNKTFFMAIAKKLFTAFPLTELTLARFLAELQLKKNSDMTKICLLIMTMIKNPNVTF